MSKRVVLIVMSVILTLGCLLCFAACGDKVNVAGKTYKLLDTAEYEAAVNFRHDQILVFGEDGKVELKYYDTAVKQYVISKKGTFEQKDKGVSVSWTYEGQDLDTPHFVFYDFDKNNNLTYKQQIEVFLDGIRQNKWVTLVYALQEDK